MRPKRLLSACLALALCLGLLPVTALAEENAPTTLYVGDQSLPVGQDSCWTTDANTGKLTEYTTGGDEWTVKYEPTSATLTLKNATIKGVVNTENIASAGIYAASSSGPVSLNIVLVGENEVTGGYGINVSSEGAASLSITGSGSLTVSATAANGIGIFVQAQSDANLTIDGANVNAVVTETNGRGVELSTGQAGNPNLTIEFKGGSLQAIGQPNGIKFFTNANNTRADANLKVSGNAMVKTSGITTDADGSGSQGAVLTTEAGSGETGGIVFDDNEGTVYGDVTLDESLTINQGETLTVPEGSTLTVPEDKILTNNGTIDNSGTLTNNGTVTNNGTLNVNEGGKLEGETTGGSGTVVNTPTITAQPESQSVTEENTATFTVAATGENLSYQWSQSTDQGESWTEISGATGSTYTTVATTTSMSGYQYRCVVSNSAGSVTSEVATLTVNEPAPTTYTITADVTPSGAGTATADKTTATAGDTVKLIATANSGYRFTGWTFSDNITDADSSSANTTFTMPAGDVTVTANFEQYYTITVNASAGGTATADKTTAVAGEAVTLTATPDSGYRLARWEVVEGDVTISGNSFTMPAENVTVRAVFSPVVNIPDTHEIELIVGDGGEAKLSLTNASAGSTITVTATPDEGYELDYITVDGERISGTTFKMPDHDVTVRVYFTDGSATLPFTDVSAGAWYLDAVSYVYANGLMDGTSGTTFEPDANMTRAMVWAILARVDGETVTGTNWIETAREWAMAEGVSDGENASGYVTREQLATMLYRYVVYKGYDVSIGEDTNILSYADFADLSEYAIPAMQWACGAGIVNGTSESTLTPQGEATRAQVAAMLMRFVEAIG